MTDFTRQRDWFDPDQTHASVTVVGCGGIGSFAAFALAKLGVQQMTLVDHDKVDEHNIPNQLFWPHHIGYDKVEALADITEEASFLVPKVVRGKLQAGVPLSDVVVSALDSMAARADLWAQVRLKPRVKLFLDGRLGGEHVVLYCVDPMNLDDIAGYEATLHSDAEGLELPCTGRSIIDIGFVIASLITRAVRKHYAGEQLPKLTYLNQANLTLFKNGEWER